MHLSTELKKFFDNHKDTENSVYIDLIKHKISNLVLTQEQVSRPNSNKIIWDDNSLNQLRELEDILFILSNNLATSNEIETVFSDRNNYDGILLKYMKEIQNQLDKLDSFIILSRLAEYRNELVNNLPQFKYPYAIKPKYSLARKAIIWIESNPQTDWNKKCVDTNPYTRIFKDFNSFKLFEYLRNQIKRNELAEYSFIYWSMHKDGLIFKGVRPSEFIEWLNDEFEIGLSELKQYNNCKGGNKIPNYQSAKLLFK